MLNIWRKKSVDFLHIVNYIEAHSNFMAYFRHLVLKNVYYPTISWISLDRKNLPKVQSINIFN